jgi:predicted AAA+ superfamily ATPase
MSNTRNIIDPLLEKVEAYGKTTFDLFKYKTLDKTAEVSSTLISRVILIVTISFFVMALNIAVALWIGDMLGKAYYGFFIVAGFYAIVSIILLVVHRSIKAKLNDVIVKQLFN